MIKQKYIGVVDHDSKSSALERSVYNIMQVLHMLSSFVLSARAFVCASFSLGILSCVAYSAFCIIVCIAVFVPLLVDHRRCTRVMVGMV